MEIIDPSRLHFDAKTKDECKRDLIEARWHGQFRCPACGHKKGYWIKKRALYECANKNCRKQTSPTAGTQFHGIHKITSLWVLIWEFETNPSELSGGLVRRKTGLSYSSGRSFIKRMARFLPISRFVKRHDLETKLLFIQRLSRD